MGDGGLEPVVPENAVTVQDRIELRQTEQAIAESGGAESGAVEADNEADLEDISDTAVDESSTPGNGYREGDQLGIETGNERGSTRRSRGCRAGELQGEPSYLLPEPLPSPEPENTSEAAAADRASSPTIKAVSQAEQLYLAYPRKEAKATGPVTIATLRRGQNFGEVALVDQGLRSATARCAANNTQLLVIPRDKLIMLCDTYPQLGYRLMRNLAADLALKIRSTDMRIREELLYGQRRRP